MTSGLDSTASINMATAANEVAEPVIASSNRYADIEPYTKRLFATDPEVWGQVLPWEFPQNGTKEQEQEFLRRFFDEREIRMQGGDENGFRFLKQVWYAAAIWNLEHRMPLVVNWWFEHNQELLSDTSMSQHFFNPDVKVGTFFEADQIKLYGEKFLGWAVKQIQARLSSPPESKKAESAAPAKITSPETRDVGEVKDTPDKLTHPPSTSSEQVAPVKATMPPTPGPKASSAVQIAAVPAAVQPEGFQPRSVSGENYGVPDQRQQQFRKNQRGSFSKRNSFSHARPNQRPPYAFNEPKFSPNPYSPFNTPTQHPGQMMPGSAPIPGRAVSGGFLPGPVDQMPALPQGQPFQGPHPPFASPAQPPYGQPPPHEQYMAMVPANFGPATGPYAPSAYANAPPFVDRSNMQADMRSYDHQQQHFNMENRSEQRPKRRDSIISRGGKSRGYGGSMRGKGSRGRNSFGQGPPDGQFFHRNMASDGDTAGFPPRDHANFQREKNWQRSSWRAQHQDENWTPYSQPRSDDARYSLQDNGNRIQVPTAYQHDAVSGFNYGPPLPGSTFSHRQAGMPEERMYRQQGDQACPSGCTGDFISDLCTTATKLVIFGVPTGLSKGDMQNYFSTYGEVRSISEPPNQPINGRNHAWVTFADVSGARYCMANKGTQWPGGTLLTAVAKEHWDPNHYSAPREYPNPVVSAPTFVPKAPMVGQEETEHQMSFPQPPTNQAEPASGEVTPKANDSNIDVVVKDSLSGDTTPTASGPSTPKKGKSKNKKRNTNKKPNNLRDGVLGKSLGDKVQDQSGHSESSREQSNATVVEATQNATPAVADETTNLRSADEPSVGADAATIQSQPSPDGSDVASHPEAAKEKSGPDRNYASVAAVTSTEKRLGSPKSEKADSVVERPANKSDEDQNDDSFHTASGTPDVEKPTAIDDEAITPTATHDHAIEQGNLVASPKGEDIAKAQSDDEAATPTASHAQTIEQGDTGATAQNEDTGKAEEDTTSNKSSTKSPSPVKGKKKAPIPQVPKASRVTIVPPPLDVEKAQKHGKPQGESLQPPQERSASGGSEGVTPGTYATAPSTPDSMSVNVPVNTATIPNPNPEPQSKKALKQKPKGPEQTESLSVFGKPKSNRKTSKATQKKSKPKRAVSQPVEEPENPKPVGDTAGSGGDDQANGPQDVQATTGTPPTEDEPSQAIGVQPFDVHSNTKAETRPASDRRPSALNRIVSFFTPGATQGGGEAAAIAKDAKEHPNGEVQTESPLETQNPSIGQEDAAEGNAADAVAQAAAPESEAVPDPDAQSEQGKDEDEEEDGDGLGISNAEGAVEEPKPKRKNNKNKNKNRSKNKKKAATAEVTETSHPAEDSHISKPFYEFKGNDVGSDASSHTADTDAGSGSSRTSDVIQAPTARRKHHRMTSSKHSNLSNSTGDIVLPSNDRRSSTATGNNVSGTDNPDNPMLIFIWSGGNEAEPQDSQRPQQGKVEELPEEKAEEVSEDVKKSRANLQQLAEQERRFKESTKGKGKEKAVEQ